MYNNKTFFKNGIYGTFQHEKKLMKYGIRNNISKKAAVHPVLLS